MLDKRKGGLAIDLEMAGEPGSSVHFLKRGVIIITLKGSNTYPVETCSKRGISKDQI